ncbi:MAG TPA: hypothetical protein VMF12_06645 [Xanthobacteraceae bacterium]|nr:hypothetical protein [Xanthobacteraceae bacterium]
MYKIIGVSVTVATVAIACVSSAFVPARAGEATGSTAAPTATPNSFPLIGTYMQNVPCKGDSTDQAALKVTISQQQIVSNIGVCTILDNKHDGASYKLHVECKFPAGPLVGDLTFTPQPDQTVKFVDRDNTYNAVLHRCPG